MRPVWSLSNIPISPAIIDNASITSTGTDVQYRCVLQTGYFPSYGRREKNNAETWGINAGNKRGARTNAGDRYLFVVVGCA